MKRLTNASRFTLQVSRFTPAATGGEEPPQVSLEWKFDAMLATMSITGPYQLDYSMALWRRITAPSLIVHGAGSGEFWRGKPGAVYLEPDDLQRRLACFRHNEFIEIPGAGHMVHFDRPRELVTAIRGFLAA